MKASGNDAKDLGHIRKQNSLVTKGINFSTGSFSDCALPTKQARDDSRRLAASALSHVISKSYKK